MKKRPIIFLFCLLFILSLTLFGCVNDGGGAAEDKTTITIDGKDASLDKGTARIDGVKAVHIPVSAKSYNFLNGIRIYHDAVLSEDLPEFDSNVVFGTAGVYTVTYTYGDIARQAEVKVYSVPEITVLSEDITLSYSEAMHGLFSGVSAEDCFGAALQPAVLDGDGIYHDDGSIKPGQFNVTAAVMDRAGNMVDFTLNITVTMPAGDAPELSSQQYNYDVVDDNLMLGITSLNGDFVSLSIAEKLVPLQEIDQAEDGFTLSAEFVFGNVKKGDNKVRLVTDKGYAEATLQVTDDKVPVIYTQGYNGYIYTVDDTVQIPQLQKHNRQSFSMEYSILSPSGSSVAVQGNSFKATEAGKYSINVAAVRGIERFEDYFLSIDVYSKEDYKSIIDPACSYQFINSGRLTTAISTAQITFFDGLLGNREGVYKYTKGPGTGWANRIVLNEELISKSAEGYTKVVLDIWIEVDNANFFVVHGGKNYYYSNSEIVKILDPSTGDYIIYGNIKDHKNKWLSMEISLEHYGKNNDNRFIFGFQGLDALEFDAYLSNIRFN